MKIFQRNFSQFYQIYPRSFKDSNDDGIGDIRGIISKLPYLKETGVTATWLSPIFKSPQADFGYDISDFTQVDPIFGTNADLEELFTEAHKLDIKIIMDFVIKLAKVDKCNSLILFMSLGSKSHFGRTRVVHKIGSR